MKIRQAIKRHRRSGLETFDGCPWRFHVLYQLCRHCGHDKALHDDHGGSCHGEGQQPCMCSTFEHIEDRGDEAMRGIAFHEAAFRYIDRLAKAKVESDPDEASSGFREGVAISQVPAGIVNQVARLWTPFVEWFQLDLDAYFEAEKQQASVFCLNCHWRGEEDAVRWTGAGTPSDPELPTCPDCGGPVHGSSWIPDLVYVHPGEIEIIDWKTFYKGLTEDQARSEFQLKMYLWQALNLWPGFQRYTFTFNFVRLRYQVSITMTPEEIETFSDEIKGIALSIYEAQRTKNYPAIPGSHCRVCRLQCPIASNKFRLPVRVTSEEERNAVAGRVLVLEQELKQTKKVLKAYCDEAGGFTYGGEDFGHWPTVERRYPADHILTWLKEHGHDVSLVTLSATGLGLLADKKKAPELVRQQLALVAQEDQGWTFRHRKHGAELPAGFLGDDALDDVDGDE